MSRYHDTRARAPAKPQMVIVAAVAANRVIGHQGKLPWHLPEDLRHFKALTTGHPVIMGRRTWESLGKPLPKRINIVVSRTPFFEAPGAKVAGSLEAALVLCADAPTAFVIGGGELYRAALPVADRLVLTEIRKDFEGDARFPQFSRGAWKETRRDARTAEDGTRYDIVTYDPVR